MSDQCEREIKRIDEKEDDGNRETDSIKMLGPSGHGFERGGENQRDCRKREHRGLRTRSSSIEVLLRVAQSSSQHGCAEHQEYVSENGADYRCFHYLV